MPTLQLRAGFTALLLAASLTAACKKADKTPPPADSSAMMAPPAAALQVASVELGKSVDANKRVTASSSTFGVRDTIYASVATTGSGSGVLVAHWTFEDGQQIEHSEQNVSTTGPANTEFHIAKASAWPAGKYRVVVSLDGREVGSKDFEIK